jgi:hypothetical protein
MDSSSNGESISGVICFICALLGDLGLDPPLPAYVRGELTATQGLAPPSHENWCDVDVESMSNQPKFLTKMDEISMIGVDSTSNRPTISRWEMTVEGVGWIPCLQSGSMNRGGKLQQVLPSRHSVQYSFSQAVMITNKLQL